MHRQILLIITVASALLSWAPAASAQENWWRMRPSDIRAGIEGKHPSAYYVMAAKLFREGRRDEAVFWFYAGQLRYRFDIVARPGSDTIVFSALSEDVGRPINQYAFGDPAKLVGIWDRVLDWDRRTPNLFTSKERNRRAYQDVRQGLIKLRNDTRRNAASIRTIRERNGLSNR